MALVKKSPRFIKPGVGGTAQRPAKSETYALPTKRIQPSTEFGAYGTAIFGEKGIGKTSLAAEFPDAIINQFEVGRNHLAIFQVPEIGQPKLNWKSFKAYLEQQLTDDRFQSIVIDTIDKAYSCCMDYVSQLNGVEHPHDAKDYGKTWSAVTREFSETMDSIKQAGKTPVWLSHAKHKTIEIAHSRQTIEKYCPTCVDKAMEYLQSCADFVFCYTFDEAGNRIIIPRGNETVWASCGVPDTFMDAKTGQPLAQIPIGGSAAEAYRNLCDGFANKLSGEVVSPAPEKEVKRRKFIKKSGE